MASSHRLNKDKGYNALERRLEAAKARFGCRSEKLTGIYMEMAEYLRNSLLLIDEAERVYGKVISLGSLNPDACALDCALAYRNLAEIAIEKDDYDSAITKISLSLEYAYKTNNPGIIQQSLHQRAHICMSCGLPKKALSYAEECFEYLEDNSEDINKLKTDGDAKCRLAHLQNFMAAIYSELHHADSFEQYDVKALEINEKALKYASEHDNWPLLYRCLLMKLDLTVGRERLDLAERMCAISSKITPTNADERKFKKESKCHFALEKLRHCEQANFIESKILLWKRFEDIKREPDSVSSDLREAVKNSLLFIYKTEQRIKKIDMMSAKDNIERRRAQMCLFEKIGDDASSLGLNEIALTFYQKMLKSCDKMDDKRKSWCSMAEAAKDCRLWTRAQAFFKEVRKLEEELGYNSKEMIDTEIAIAIVSSEIAEISLEERLKNFRSVYKKCITEEQKLNILPDYIKFLKTCPNLCAIDEMEEKLHEKNCIEKMEFEVQGDNHFHEEQAERDEFDDLDEKQILFNIEQEMKALERTEKIVKEKTNKNKHGESSLHEVARSGEYQQLKELIEKGYDINQLDHGGWTPLSEAVSAQNLANVRLLLMKGANPNSRSKEFLVDEEQNKITSSGLTPLMEACSVGNIEIARMLLQFKARASEKDDDDWTAFEYLREFMLNSKNLHKSMVEKTQKFAELLEQRQNEEGFAARTNEDFLELLEQKRIASQRTSQKKNNCSQQSSRSEPIRRQIRKRGSTNLTPSPQKRPSSSPNSLEEKNNSIWLDEYEEESAKDENNENEGEKNLEHYRDCIEGLRKGRNRDMEDPEFSETALSLMNRKRIYNTTARNGPFAKRLFLK